MKWIRSRLRNKNDDCIQRLSEEERRVLMLCPSVRDYLVEEEEEQPARKPKLPYLHLSLPSSKSPTPPSLSPPPPTPPSSSLPLLRPPVNSFLHDDEEEMKERLEEETNADELELQITPEEDSLCYSDDSSYLYSLTSPRYISPPSHSTCHSSTPCRSPSRPSTRCLSPSILFPHSSTPSPPTPTPPPINSFLHNEEEEMEERLEEETNATRLEVETEEDEVDVNHPSLTVSLPLRRSSRVKRQPDRFVSFVPHSSTPVLVSAPLRRSTRVKKKSSRFIEEYANYY